MFDPKTHASPNFTWAELFCRCGCKAPPAVKNNLKALAEKVLEPLRTKLGGHPLFVTSAYRCRRYNAAIGGAPASQHPEGNAADVVSKLHMPTVVAHAAESIPDVANGGLGRYTGFTHVDRRGYKARW